MYRFIVLTMVSILGSAVASASYPEASVLLKKAQTCAEVHALLAKTMFKPLCTSNSKARAYTVSYLGNESLTKALKTLRKNDKISDASLKNVYKIAP